MPPTPTWYRGREAIEAFLAAHPMSGRVRWRHLPASANGQPAVGCYIWDPDTGSFEAQVVDVLTLRGDRIAAITAFLGTEVFRTLGLPDRV
jgi:RNA polymerase sigma-70 factor (ECF subfamily)